MCVILILSVWGCRGKQKSTQDVLARVGTATFTQQQLDDVMPSGLSDSAQMVFANRYIDNWIAEELLYEMACKNLPDVERLEKLVQEYRRDLFCHEYRKRLSDERVAASIPEDTLQQFYQEHSQEFKLHKPIVKGLLLKVPINAPQLQSLRQWVKSAGVNGVEKIEKYAVKNAIGYDYFFDRWVWFDDIKDNIPYDFKDDNLFLSQNKTFEHKGEDMIYLLCIDSYLKAGDIMPYEFARSRVLEILLNEKRMEFNKELKRELYDEAVADGIVELFYNTTVDTTATNQ
ncbi:MAG: peptidyl-prolyl cis-trans isomerase [Bacteroidaceae bacterium]|nr:peptidyl-prolyl cis-trans isomerase [Bacteroidaceae bacterium]